MSDRTAVCIAGMHRSGTSMVAHLLNQCGLYLGRTEDLLPASQSNPDGHWEHERIVEINEQILSEFGGGWDSPPALSGLGDGARTARFRPRAEAVLREFAPHPFWGWKDPRNSLTLPFWQSLISNLKVVICLRNPMEVAMSLRRRGYSSYEFGLSLWTVYNESLLRTTSPAERVVTAYVSHLNEPIREIRRLAERLGVVVSDAQLAGLNAGAQGLRHSHFTLADLVAAGVSNHVVGLYEQLCAEAEQSEASGQSTSGRRSEQMEMPTPVMDASDTEPVGRFDRDAFECDLLRGQVKSRDLAVRELQSRVDSEQARAREAAALASALEERVSELTAEGAGTLARLARLQAEIEEQAIVVGELTAAVSERDAALARSREEAAAEINDLREALGSRVREALRMQARLDEQATTQNGLTQQVTRHETEARGLREALESQAAETHRAALERARCDAMTQLLEQQAAERSAWAFRMLEALMPRQGPLEAQAAAVNESAPAGDRQHPRGHSSAVEADWNNAREETARLEAALREEQDARQRLEEVVKRDYHHLQKRVIEAMDQVIPAKATILMVSHGEEALVGETGRPIWHFPQTPDGAWDRHRPADSAAAIAHLEELMAKGATYLAFPSPARWWLEHYQELRAHLGRYPVIFDRPDTGVIGHLVEPAWRPHVDAVIAEFETRLGRAPALLDWDSGLGLAAVLSGHAVFSPPERCATLPYLDGSVDIVVCQSRSTVVAEARRVASGAIVTVDRADGDVRVTVSPIGQPAPPRAARRLRVRSAAVQKVTAPRARTRRVPARGKR